MLAGEGLQKATGIVATELGHNDGRAGEDEAEANSPAFPAPVCSRTCCRIIIAVSAGIYRSAGGRCDSLMTLDMGLPPLRDKALPRADGSSTVEKLNGAGVYRGNCVRYASQRRQRCEQSKVRFPEGTKWKRGRKLNEPHFCALMPAALMI